MQVFESIDITADPDAVWAVVGDPATVSTWVPALESSSLVGNLRHAVFAGGAGKALERIVELDAAARTYVYDYVEGPLALTRYRSRITVSATPTGARVDWDSELAAASPEEEAALAEAIHGIYRDALVELARQVAGRPR